MDTKHFERKIRSYLRDHSGLEPKRAYIGISRVGQCPRRAYYEILNGVRVDDFSHQLCYAGYLFERDAVYRLEQMEFAVPGGSNKEVVCPDNTLIRGHIDGVTFWGDLLEIKSVSSRKFDIITHQDRPLHEHTEQVQLYMKYGGWKEAWIIYICRDTFEHKVIRVRYSPDLAASLEERLLYLSACVKNLVPPACECGKCGE
jgi:hypothetical protein